MIVILKKVLRLVATKATSYLLLSTARWHNRRLLVNGGSMSLSSARLIRVQHKTPRLTSGIVFIAHQCFLPDSQAVIHTPRTSTKLRLSQRLSPCLRYDIPTLHYALNRCKKSASSSMNLFISMRAPDDRLN